MTAYPTITKCNDHYLIRHPIHGTWAETFPTHLEALRFLVSQGYERS